MTGTAQPKLFRSGEGRKYQLGRITLMFKTGPADNAGAYSLCEAIEPPDSGAGLHRHATYDETHIICDGQYECRLGDQTLRLGPGDMMFVPRGTPHSVKSLGPQDGREIIVSSPSGVFDAFIDEVVAAMAKSGGTADFQAIAAKYGIEFLD